MMKNNRNPIQVFEMVRCWADEPVTIFAKDLGEAESLYRAWIEAHQPDKPIRPVTVHLYSGFHLEARPELVFASIPGGTGIGYWDRLVERWVVGAPSDAPVGELARPESAVKFHHVAATDGDELMVFAESFEEAVGYYVCWHLEAYGDAPKGSWPDDGLAGS